MKLLCIESCNSSFDSITKGEIYTLYQVVVRIVIAGSPIWYKLEEKPEEFFYHSSLFSEIDELPNESLAVEEEQLQTA